jgi:hypothetical protein
MVQSLRNGVPLLHAPPVQVCGLVQAMHVAPPVPQALSVVPDKQVFPLQQPLHAVASQTHVPAEQRWPVLHEPVWQVPPHPSLAPHALPVQLGVHGQREHVPGRVVHGLHAVHSAPALPVQLGVQPVHNPSWHMLPLPVHAVHSAPLFPHALEDVPGRHAPLPQHPEHDVGSQTHVPPSQ